MSTVASAAERANQRNAVLAGFLGWTLDAFDFFILTFVVVQVAHDFHRSVPDIVLTISACLFTRPVGAFIFGLLADHYGRRTLLISNIIFYSIVEVLSGLAPSYAIFFALRLLYGVGMGGEWGVGASLALESVPARLRGVISGLLQEGYAVGYIIAAVAYATVFPHFGWRVMFFVGGLPGLLSLFIITKVKEPEAWHQAKTDWGTYKHSLFSNWKLFIYLVVLMSFMNFISHGTQDLYPTFLQVQHGFSVHLTSVITVVSMIGAILGGLAFGLASNHFGRKRCMIVAALLAVLTIPLWALAASETVILAGAFLMQFMVQGAWGVIPAHLNELSPGALRGFFPGFAYQLGAAIAGLIAPIEAVLARQHGYSTIMAGAAALVLIVGSIVIALGPEARGVAFVQPASVPGPKMHA